RYRQAKHPCTSHCYVGHCHRFHPAPWSRYPRQALKDSAMQDQCAELEWRPGDVPVSLRFDDPYFSLVGGLDETRHVFLGGNDLPARFCDGFHVAELGFGSGLYLLATAEAWAEAGISGALHLTSFEAYPMSADEMARALAAFPELGARAE